MKSVFGIPVVAMMAAVVICSALLGVSWLYPDTRWHNEPLHSAMEALGALCALVMGIVLWQRTRDECNRHAPALASGFLGMGVLEMCHAISAPGNAFILLRHLASIAGGLGFALVWLPPRGLPRLTQPLWPWLVGIGALGLGSGLIVWSGELPEMMRNGQFAPTAVAPVALASLLFVATSLWFFAEYRRDRWPEMLLFAGLTFLFGIAEMMVTYSMPWDARWWFWHGLRLLAYMLALGYLVKGYQQMVSDLRVSLTQTQQAEEAVRRNEQHLRRAIEQRELIAQDLHDGIIQTLFAMSLSLERCQRMVTADPEEVARQLGIGAQSLKAAIRDLRVFIAGLEPQVTDARELEAALALQVRLLNASGDLHIELRVDPGVADAVTPMQATHLLHVAREAISNSLRHARATRADVTLDRHESRVRLRVKDDGVGFVVDGAQAGEGLKNMAARAAKMKGTLTVVSRPGDGTQVVFDVPVERVYA
jgi:signal transduction histidine kinase